MSMRHFIIIVTILCGLISLPVNGPARDAADTGPPGSECYVFGVEPKFGQRNLYARWEPVIKELEKRTGLDFKLVTTLNINDFEREFVKGGFDFAYMNPYHVLKAAGVRGYIPLVRDKTPLRSIVVARKDGPIRNVNDLNGKVVAFPSPNTLTSLLTRADLEKMHHVKITPLYVRTHRSVYLHVANGLAPAGAGTARTFQEQDEEVRNSLRIIHTTRGIPSYPVVAHSRVPAEEREKVRKALLAMGNTPEGRELLSKIPVKRITSASMDDYEIMLGWGLENYWDPFWLENDL